MPGTIRHLDQVRALADPLRLRIVEVLAEEARTVMQVARLLRRKPTGLYHHVRVLEAAGLLREERTQQKRGTIERYYRAVHAELRIDPRVFEGGRATSARRDVATSVLEAAERDLRRGGSTPQPMLALRLALALDATRLGEVESVLQAWADSHRANARVPCQVTLVAHPAVSAASRTCGAAGEARRPRSSGRGTGPSRRR